MAPRSYFLFRFSFLLLSFWCVVFLTFAFAATTVSLCLFAFTLRSLFLFRMAVTGFLLLTLALRILLLFRRAFTGLLVFTLTLSILLLFRMAVTGFLILTLALSTGLATILLLVLGLRIHPILKLNWKIFCQNFTGHLVCSWSNLGRN